MMMMPIRMSPIWCLLFFLFGCLQFKVNYAASDDTKQADPLTFSTNECFLTEPVYGHLFNFTNLQTDFAHWTRGEYGDTFEFNICGNLTRTCNGRTDVAACLKKADKKEYVLGTHHLLEYHNGKMYFTFSNGEKCPNSSDNYKLHVYLGCDYTLDKDQSRVTSYSSNACSFYITFETPLACLPEPENVKGNDCSVRDPKTGHMFNLMPLSDSNYRISDRQGNAFIINVCKPVLYSENAMCPAESSVCFQKPHANYKEKFFNYGTAQPRPTIENNNLVIRHTSPTPCNGATNYSSVLNFYCDKDVKNAHPVLMGFKDCVYTFTFATPLACQELPSCTVVAHDNEIIDMSPLRNSKFTLEQDNQSYVLSICSATGEPCMETDGACLQVNNQSTSLGKSNDHLRINQTGTPYLLYEDGAICQKTSDGGTRKWSTKIEFVCANRTEGSNSKDKNVGPKIIENSNCQLLIHYQTELACREQISCRAKVYVDHSEDGTGTDFIDLSPLISNTDNYEAEIDAALIAQHQQLTKSTKIFLNVCRPLVPKYALGCPGGSAACMAKIDKNTGKPEEEQSLGFPLASLVPINRTSAELRYLLGSPCPEDKNTLMSSKIEVTCQMRAGRYL
ncbi:cation-independent mannose-6-phosphate receptor [Musca vetustissima]|uniref:cation-independent mannose-6-phosphate receptor n=1 Tax=Musca vetustissima TaxID=27455 RepID=UPI002AB72F67|nr:cation-independent mannose-6-phosphate receptor [Musca vetustissima]